MGAAAVATASGGQPHRRGDGDEAECADHTGERHAAEHRVLEGGPSGEEQGGSAEDDGNPGRIRVSQRVLDAEFVADGDGDHAGDTGGLWPS